MSVAGRTAKGAALAAMAAIVLASCGGSSPGSASTPGFVVASAPASVPVQPVATGSAPSAPSHAEPSGSAVATAPPVPVASASAELADYRVTIATDRTVFRTVDAIPITTTLTYLGPAAASAWWGSGSGPIRFLVEQLDGPLRTGGLMTADCGGPHAMPRGVASSVPFVKSGELADMPAGWFDGPAVHMAPGLWRITAETAFILAPGCGGGEILMDASLVIRVDP